MPTAGTISLAETLALLDGEFAPLAEAFAKGQYALWLGSGISRDRVVGLDGVLLKLLEFLRSNATTSPGCRYKTAFDKVIQMASPSAEERKDIDLARPAAEWPCIGSLLRRLWGQYSKVLSVEVGDEKSDYLLWVGLDFKHTFATQEPDAEHLAIGMLALEGAVSELATANWDALIEGAMTELGHADDFYQVTVTGEDLRGPPSGAKLYKFHGCAKRAIENESVYRPLLVARSGQITSWMSNDKFKIVRDQLEALVQRSHTLVIGLSAQDEDIKNIFGQANKAQGWKWNETPQPIVFSADTIGDDHKNLLMAAYGDDEYENNRTEICQATCLRAYGKPLLLALLISVLTVKLKVLAGDAEAPNLDAGARTSIAGGIHYLRDCLALADDANDRLGFVRKLATSLARARHQLQDGKSGPGRQPYYPLDGQPPQMMTGKLALKSTGQREAAAALGLIGLDAQSGVWRVGVDAGEKIESGALRLTTKDAEARVFFVANDDSITSLLECGAFAEDDADAVIVCSRRATSRQQRSPRANLRSGVAEPRYVSLGPTLAEAATLDELRTNFRDLVAL